MSERAEALAREFEQANNNLIELIEPMSDAQWKATCAGEGWSAGVTAHHAASAHPNISLLVQAGAAGGPLPPITPEIIDQGNARHAQEAANCSKEETLALLRQNGPAAAAIVRSLSDEQLARSVSLFGQPTTVEQIIQDVLIGHPVLHTNSIQQAR